jgi:hypothetical protein
MEHFYWAQPNLSLLHKIGWRSAEKNSPFFEHASSSVAPTISMVLMLLSDTQLKNGKMSVDFGQNFCVSPTP